MKLVAQYFFGIFQVHRSVLEAILSKILIYCSAKIQIYLRNVVIRMTRQSYNFGFDQEKSLFFIRDGERRQYFSTLSRGLRIYRHGLGERAEKIWSSYLLDNIKFEKSSIVIDCGANYGDLWISLERTAVKPENYITFEPGRGEFLALKNNAPNARNFNVGLGDRDGVADFFISEDNADSSLIEPSGYSHVIKTETIRLDTFLKREEIHTVKLLKLEAEGFEPEIIKGAGDELRRIEYIAIDGGPERGVSQDETFSLQVNLLVKSGFELVGINFKGYRALLKRSDS